MTNEQLCALALAAIDDADARVVLADAIEERGERYDHYALQVPWHVYSVPWFSGQIREPHVIAAVLLFGSWPTRWELAERCRLDERLDVVAWEQYGISRYADESETELRSRMLDEMRRR